MTGYVLYCWLSFYQKLFDYRKIAVERIVVVKLDGPTYYYYFYCQRRGEMIIYCIIAFKNIHACFFIKKLEEITIIREKVEISIAVLFIRLDIVRKIAVSCSSSNINRPGVKCSSLISWDHLCKLVFTGHSDFLRSHWAVECENLR